MKVMHIIGGGDIGGAKTHVLSLLEQLKENIDITLVALRQGEFAEEAFEKGIHTIVLKEGFKNDLHFLTEKLRLENFDLIHFQLSNLEYC